MIELNWTELKSIVDSKLIKLQYKEGPRRYNLFAADGAIIYSHEMDKSPIDTTDLNDFETNYKPNSNKPVTEVDSEGRQHTRQAAAKKGWSYLAHVIEMESSKLNCLYSKDYNGTDRGDVTIKYYDSVNAELIAGTQAELDSSCVKSVITWKPNYDYELIGGNIHQIVQPTTDVRLWVVGGVPELGSAGLGEFVGGLNLSFMGADSVIETDGRASKYMKKTTTGIPYNTNQMQVIIRHDAGHKHRVKLLLEYFRA